MNVYSGLYPTAIVTVRSKREKSENSETSPLPRLYTRSQVLVSGRKSSPEERSLHPLAGGIYPTSHFPPLLPSLLFFFCPFLVPEKDGCYRKEEECENEDRSDRSSGLGFDRSCKQCQHENDYPDSEADYTRDEADGGRFHGDHSFATIIA